ncbi:UBX domain-containing protein 6 [Polypterus senegalus]|uniref:UBX domain-containing protein 6 n=1 Tax=Polypterus senegalus TaxID=55291 RepID=UPI0019654800|nr:UBX domain-containing protein 6 [Polypterus senegalus]
MKKFLEDIKKDIKFKSAGPGKKLNEESSSSKEPAKEPAAPAKPRYAPSEGSQMAGAAALARIQHQQKPRPLSSQDAIRNQVKKELMAEAAAAASTTSVHKDDSKTDPKEDATLFSVSGVYFICPLTGTTLKKNERENHIKEAILMKFADDPLEASIMMVHTFNKDREKVSAAIEVIGKYIDNICNNPTEEKYRKIKLSNKIFQEKIHPLEGTQEFLQAVGFEKKSLEVSGQENMEEFYVISEEALVQVEHLKECKTKLMSAEPVRAKLDRQPRVFKPSPQASRFELPADFYNLTAEELKKEQQMRSEAVERNSMLRTKAMRERDEQREMRKYNYTLVRVRLPDGNLLQGTFYAREKVSDVYEFVRSHLLNSWQPFELRAPAGQKLNESTALNECGLVPAALLTFVWDAAIQADIEAACAQSQDILTSTLMSSIETLT